MCDELIVNVYDVGFGDCIHIQIPDKNDVFHILIDCGSTGVDKNKADKAQTILKNALDHVREHLPDIPGSRGDSPGKKRLDLLVVTHPHMDHISGLDPKYFANICIGQIWMSAFFMDNHPQAKQARALQKAADAQATALLANALRGGRDASEALEDLLIYRLLDEDRLEQNAADKPPVLSRLLKNSICNKNALAALKKIGPDKKKWLDPDSPRVYVARDKFEPQEAGSASKLNLMVDEVGLYLGGFKEKDTRLRVLAPEWDIDGSYLGSLSNKLCLDDQSAIGAGTPERVEQEEPWDAAQKVLKNISAADFNRLQGRLMSSALAFSQEDDSLKNDTSVVLLLEWRGRRLLFPGDAEFHGQFKAGARNSCWDVMLANVSVCGLLEKGLHFWKIGHHGSINGSPFYSKVDDQPHLKMLAPETARPEIVVSTWGGKFKDVNPVPLQALMNKLGERSARSKQYEPSLPPQPLRTDLEDDVPGQTVRYIEVPIKAA